MLTADSAPFTRWCNGNTRDFDSLIPGSSPSPVARKRGPVHSPTTSMHTLELRPGKMDLSPFSSPEAQFATEVVREAAILVRRVQSEMVTGALSKGDRSPVTVADF